MDQTLVWYHLALCLWSKSSLAFCYERWGGSITKASSCARSTWGSGGAHGCHVRAGGFVWHLVHIYVHMHGFTFERQYLIDSRVRKQWEIFYLLHIITQLKKGYFLPFLLWLFCCVAPAHCIWALGPTSCCTLSLLAYCCYSRQCHPLNFANSSPSCTAAPLLPVFPHLQKKEIYKDRKNHIRLTKQVPISAQIKVHLVNIWNKVFLMIFVRHGIGVRLFISDII